MLKPISILVIFLIFSCTNENEKNEVGSGETGAIKNKAPKDLKTLLFRVKQLEDSITTEVTKDPNKPIGSFVFLDLINRLKDVANNFPEAPETAGCLFKLHMKYGEMKGFKESLCYGDTLLNRFPSFKDRNLLLQSMATTYDLSLKPRDSKKVEYYLKLLLESKTLPENEKAEIKNRLKYINLDVLAYSTKLNSSKITR